jgi:hypothetical protein
MGYARYIGRVGALAVTLGVGAAMASGPGVAYAEPSSSMSSTSDSSTTGKSSSTTGKSSSTTGKASSGTASSGSDAASQDGPDGKGVSSSDPTPPSGATDRSTASTDDDGDDGEGTAKGDGAEEQNNGGGDEETPPAEGDEDTSSKDAVPAQDDVSVQKSASIDSAKEQVSNRHAVSALAPHASGDVEPSVTAVAGQSSPSRGSQMRTTRAAAYPPAQGFSANASAVAVTTAATTSTTSFAAAASAPAAPQQRPTLVSVVSDLVAAVLRPLMSPGPWSPIQPTLLLGVLSAVRNEIERALFRRTAPVASQYTVAQLDATPNSVPADPTPNVLVIGVDGTNLSRILADDRNQNFFDLMEDSTTAASSIVGHTTISNPSWTAMLTGVWGERTGVINNVFTPWTYDKWPTVFNQLEAHNSDIQTTTIADWNVINAISGAGSIPVDENIYIPQIQGDTDWSKTDDAVGDATVDAIENTPEGVPSFLFSYFVGVDENGHMHGGASPQYADAIVNVDENLGDILAAVQAWETAHPEEGEWTIIAVTDHGHQPQVGFGHGFQTPDETATFVIASGPDFNDGFVNPDYEIVDTTPTVLTLFGALPPANSDGVSLTTLGPGEEPVDLHQALEEMIAMNHSPDIVTDVALSLRTIFATIPYYVYNFTSGGTLPIPILGDVLYVATNIPAQIVAWLTGVTGASIFPLLPPGPPSWPGQDEATEPDTAILACGGRASGSAAESLCDAGNVA